MSGNGRQLLQKLQFEGNNDSRKMNKKVRVSSGYKNRTGLADEKKRVSQGTDLCPRVHFTSTRHTKVELKKR